MEISIISGRNDYAKRYYHEVIKKDPKLLEAQRARWRRQYYATRHEISARRKAKRIAQGGRNYRRHKPLKPSPIREQKWKKRNGVIFPVLHDYPRYRTSRCERSGDGFVV